MHRKLISAVLFFALLLTLCGCGQPNGDAPFVDEMPLESPTQQEQEAVTAAPAIPDILSPVASGIAVSDGDEAVIDYSNVTDGYVMAQYKAETDKKLKVLVKGPTTTYTYTIRPGGWNVFPLSDGNGSYQVSVYRNVEDSKYATVQTASFEAALKDEFAPFLRPNQYVNYDGAEDTVYLAARLTAGMTDPLDKVAAVYTYVVENITYDKEQAKTVKSGYLPDLDAVLERGKGICFDYAALMAGMLRSQSVPCKLVVGYAGEVYHAWISVYSEQDGWIDNVIWFDGQAWKRMDPTFASSNNSSDRILEYIGDGENYTAKYLY